MSGLDEVRTERLKKLELLTAQGLDPYPSRTKRTHTIAQALSSFQALEREGGTIVIAGRVMVVRGQGAIMFVDLFDGTGKLQAVMKEDTLDENVFALFKDVIDGGDFIEVVGSLFVTQRGEQSILVTNWKMLTKTLLPLPDKYHGLQEERFRKRYLDLLTKEEERELFRKKEIFWAASREFMRKEGFMEVETPTLEVTTGGAEARPFITHHNDFDMPVFLRISVGELWQKRLLAAGFPKVFEIGRVYRNEGSSPEHLQEFTNMECYGAYMDYRSGMQLVERMVKEVVEKTFGTLQFSIKGFSVNLGTKWDVIEYVPYVEEKTGINVLTASLEDMKARLTELGVTYEGENRERLTDTLWKYCRKTIAGPVWLIHHPRLVSPLAKAREENPETVERCQLILAGSEFCNSFSELNDPLDQRARFELQQELIERGDDEAMMADWEYVEMLEHGMPPAFGSAPVGERLFSVLAGRTIRETQLFPLMRPKEGEKVSGEKEVAVVVVDRTKLTEAWQVLNTVAHVSASFAARTGKKLFFEDVATTKDGARIPLNIQHAIMIKEGTDLGSIADELPEGCSVYPFTREMLETTNDKKVLKETKEKSRSEIEYLGVLIFGPRSVVEEFTQDYPRYA
jgi:lysyl-tRNA synthetase, class II